MKYKEVNQSGQRVKPISRMSWAVGLERWTMKWKRDVSIYRGDRQHGGNLPAENLQNRQKNQRQYLVLLLIRFPHEI